MLDTRILALLVQDEPLWVTGIGFPAIVIVVERCEKLFDPAKIVIVAGPVPLALLDTLSQGADGTADQLQLDGSVRLKFRIPPFKSKVTERGLITGS